MDSNVQFGQNLQLAASESKNLSTNTKIQQIYSQDQNNHIEADQNSIAESLRIKRKFIIRISIIVTLIVIVLGVTMGLVFGLKEKSSPETISYLTQESNSQINDYIPDEPYKEGDEVAQIFDIVRLNTTEALCLDGSPGSYLISRTGDQSRILIFFQGGAWCYGDDYNGALNGCFQRRYWLGSSNSTFVPQTTVQINNIFSKHPDNEFRNWKKIYFNYCDGSGHQGGRKDPIEVNGSKIYLRGEKITTERFEDLEKKIGLFSKAKRVVVGGVSAGGVAALMWTNYLVDRVVNGKVYTIVDSSMFPDTIELSTKTNVFKKQMQYFMEISNSETEIPASECAAEFPNEKVNCFYPEHLHKFIRAPMFFVQSLYDSWSLRNAIGIKCSSMSNCSKEYVSAAEEYRKNVTNLIGEITSKSGNGAFAISCELHGMVHYLYTDERFTVPSGTEWTVGKAIGDWFRDIKGEHRRVDSEGWPNNGGCKDLIFFY